MVKNRVARQWSLSGIDPGTNGYATWNQQRRAVHVRLDTVRALGIGFVAYSPLGRGFLTARIINLDELPKNDWRRRMPRFEGENFRRNLELVEKIRAYSADKGCTPAQLTLAWVLAQGDDIVPIPGTKRRQYLEENVGALDVRLTPEELTELDGLLPPGAAAGARYPEPGMRAVNR
jgi:aryl-alcohol dehydrogenase-like predicted oxidoreductase